MPSQLQLLLGTWMRFAARTSGFLAIKMSELPAVLLTKTCFLASPSGLSFLSFYARWESLLFLVPHLFDFGHPFSSCDQEHSLPCSKPIFKAIIGGRSCFDLSLATAVRFRKKNQWELIIIIKYNVHKYLEFLLRKITKLQQWEYTRSYFLTLLFRNVHLFPLY